jgi:HAD superfamily hydrolase (TIGR01509 family)
VHRQRLDTDQPQTIAGRLSRGLGRAADFTRLDWVRSQLLALAGIDPYPGTVNITLTGEADLGRWHAWRRAPAQVMEPADAAFCRARCHAVRIEGRVPAAIVLPEVPAYPDDKVELVAALPVRQHLSLDEGALLSVELCRPLAAKAVLFDIDGTLVDSVGAFLEVARVAARPHGLEVTERHVRECLATGSNFWRRVVPDVHPDCDALRKAMSALAASEWPGVLREHGKVFEGVAQTLDALKRLGIALGIVSGARPEVLELLREAGILERFDSIVLAADVARRKPDPEGIVKCLRQLGVAPDDAIYVGDTPLDIQASRAAGVRAVGILSGACDSGTLSAHEPDRLVFSHAALLRVVKAQ